MTSDKVRAHHLERKALLYVRQSSTHQVLHNRESSALQYAMRDRLTALGWSEIEVIDDDLGRSAAGSLQRAGFERMVAEVCLARSALSARAKSRALPATAGTGNFATFRPGSMAIRRPRAGRLERWKDDCQKAPAATPKRAEAGGRHAFADRLGSKGDARAEQVQPMRRKDCLNPVSLRARCHGASGYFADRYAACAAGAHTSTRLSRTLELAVPKGQVGLQPSPQKNDWHMKASQRAVFGLRRISGMHVPRAPCSLPQFGPRISADDCRNCGTVLTLLKVQLTGRFVGARVRHTPLLRIGQLAEHVACGRSVQSGSFLVHLDGKICSA
jgi:hypothetical protein